MAEKIVQTAGREQLGDFAPTFAHLNDDVLFGEVWNEYCRSCTKPVDGEWYPEIECYEKKVLEARA